MSSSVCSERGSQPGSGGRGLYPGQEGGGPGGPAAVLRSDARGWTQGEAEDREGSRQFSIFGEGVTGVQMDFDRRVARCFQLTRRGCRDQPRVGRRGRGSCPGGGVRGSTQARQRSRARQEQGLTWSEHSPAPGSVAVLPGDLAGLCSVPSGVALGRPAHRRRSLNELMLMSCLVVQEAGDGEAGLRLCKWG